MATPDVRVGQRVRCIRPAPFLSEGRTYVIHEVCPSLFPDEPPMIDVHAPEGHLYGLWRFDLLHNSDT